MTRQIDLMERVRHFGSPVLTINPENPKVTMINPIPLRQDAFLALIDNTDYCVKRIRTWR